MKSQENQILIPFLCIAMWEFWHILFPSLLLPRCVASFYCVTNSVRLNSMASSSRGRSSSPFSYRKPSTPYSSTSSSSSFTNGRLMPRSGSSSSSSFFNSGGRSMTPSRGRSESTYNGSQGYAGRSPVAFGEEDLVAEPVDSSRTGDSISVTIRFRPLR